LRDKNPHFSKLFGLFTLVFTPSTWYNKHGYFYLNVDVKKPLLIVFAAHLQRLFTAFYNGLYKSFRLSPHQIFFPSSV